MTKIIVYSSEHCPHCTNAKTLLSKKGLDYIEIMVGQDVEKLKEMVALSKRRTVPQIFINDRHIGGFDDLHEFDQSGKLDALLAEEKQQ